MIQGSKTGILALALAGASATFGCGGGESINLRTARKPVYITVGDHPYAPLVSPCAPSLELPVAGPRPPVYSAPGAQALAEPPRLLPAPEVKPEEPRPLPEPPIPPDPPEETPPAIDPPMNAPRSTSHFEPSRQGEWTAIPNSDWEGP